MHRIEVEFAIAYPKEHQGPFTFALPDLPCIQREKDVALHEATVDPNRVAKQEKRYAEMYSTFCCRGHRPNTADERTPGSGECD